MIKKILNLLPKRKRIIFGLGCNLGDRALNLENAVSYLTKDLNLSQIRVSNIFKNKAMLLKDSPKEWDIEFFNIALSANININKFNPEKILLITQNIEKKLGRKKRDKWAPREIDIDILAIENLEIKIGDKLIIPHYDLQNRDFFVKTIKEIEPHWKF